jgi:hypothetical protein
VGLRAGAGPAVVVSVVVVLVGVLLLVLGAGSATGAFGWVLIAVGALFGVLDLALLRRGR